MRKKTGVKSLKTIIKSINHYLMKTKFILVIIFFVGLGLRLIYAYLKYKDGIIDKFADDEHYFQFAKEIVRNSKVKLFMVENYIQLAKFLKENMYGKKIVVGMGAGSISNWMRDLSNLM